MKKLATNTGVIMLAIIAVSGVSIFFNFDEIFAPDNKASKTIAGSLIVGNVEVVKRDGSGNIVAYRQGDNHIVLGGMEIIARQVFGNSHVSSLNANSSFWNATATQAGLANFGGGVVQYMEIGNGSLGTTDCLTEGAGPPILGFDNATLECPLFLVNQADPCLRQLAIITRNNATEQPVWGVTDAAQLNLTAVATFSGATPNSCAAQFIGEAGIWQNASIGPAGHVNRTTQFMTDNVMFARNTFGTVNLSTSDSLEPTWKFTFTDN